MELNNPSLQIAVNESIKRQDKLMGVVVKMKEDSSKFPRLDAEIKV